jgi:hypothetical protein
MKLVCGVGITVTLSGIELILIISNDDKNNITRHSSARKGIMNTVPEMHEMDSRIIDATYAYVGIELVGTGTGTVL